MGCASNAPMINVFVSYRRNDNPDAAGRIYDALKDEFGKNSVFFDIDAVPPGVDFEHHLDLQVAKCDVMVVVIGSGWFETTGDGDLRINDPADYVHVEIKSALERDIPVVPILVGDIGVPRAQDLPAPLQPLAKRQALEVRSGVTFRAQIAVLIHGIRQFAPSNRKPLIWGLGLAAVTLLMVVMVFFGNIDFPTPEPAVQGGVTERINNAWRDEPLVFCREAISDRYPIDRMSRTEVRLSDFGAFFGPGGIVDSFFDDYLSDYVDRSGSPWRLRPDADSPDISAEALGQFERAYKIRGAFFEVDRVPGVRFEMTPLRMDSDLTRFELFFNGQTIAYRHGPAVSTTMTWPGEGPREVRFVMEPAGPSGDSNFRVVGDWAWFRALDSASVRPLQRPEQIQVDFSLDGRTVSYRITTKSTFHPFRLPELGEFSCPARLIP